MDGHTYTSMPATERDIVLGDFVDRLLGGGVVIGGGTTLSSAEVRAMYLQLDAPGPSGVMLEDAVGEKVLRMPEDMLL